MTVVIPLDPSVWALVTQANGNAASVLSEHALRVIGTTYRYPLESLERVARDPLYAVSLDHAIDAIRKRQQGTGSPSRTFLLRFVPPPLPPSPARLSPYKYAPPRP